MRSIFKRNELLFYLILFFIFLIVLFLNSNLFLLDNVFLLKIKNLIINNIINQGTEGFVKSNEDLLKVSRNFKIIPLNELNLVRSVFNFLCLIFVSYFLTKIMLAINKIGQLRISTKEEKVTFIASFVAIGLIIMGIVHYILGFYCNLPPPFNSYLIDSTFRFSDYYDILKLSPDLNPYDRQEGWGGYLPLSYLFLYPFTLIPSKFAFIFIFTSSISILIWIQIHFFKIEFKSVKNKFNLFIFGFFNYPVLFCLDRGNLEFITFTFVALFFYFYHQKDFLKSIFFLACATCMKGYPIYFALLFLADRKFLSFIYTGILSFIIYVTSLLFMKGTIYSNLLGWLKAIEYYKKVMISSGEGFAFGTTLYPASKFLNKMLMYDSTFLEKFFQFLNSIGFISCILYVLFCKSSLWKKSLLLVFSLLAFSTISADYRLLYLFIPLGFFLNSTEKFEYTYLYCIIFTLLLIPKNFLYLENRISVSILISPYFLVLAIVLILKDSIPGFKFKKDFLK